MLANSRLSRKTTKQVASPLITAQEHRSTNTDPHRPGPNTLEERSSTLLPYDATRKRSDTLAPSTEHHPRLQDVERRSESRSNSPRHRAKQRTLNNRDIRLPLASRPLLHALPQRELNHRKRHLPHNRDAPPAIQLPPHVRKAMRTPLAQNVLQRRQRARKLLRLRSLFDDFRRHAHRARSYLAHAGRQHVAGRFAPCAALARRQLSLDALVGDEEKGGARGGAYDGGADARIDAFEAAAGEEAGGGLQACL